MKRHKRKICYTGMVLGNLIVSDYIGEGVWQFQCKCGTVFSKNFYTEVWKKKIFSCGCKVINHHKYKRKILGPEFNSWLAAKTRCSLKTHADYKNYGGRGITMCEEWKNDYYIFLRDMGRKPTPKHTIERIDNDKGYYPGNCRWATVAEQNRNKRTTIWVTYRGKKTCLKEACDKESINYYDIHSWLKKYPKLEFEEAIQLLHSV